MADSEQSVEMALLILNHEINKVQGVRKVTVAFGLCEWLVFNSSTYFHLKFWIFQALSVLSKALENDPTSVVLWIVYLLIYYGNLKPNDKDDMFLCAVCFSLLPNFV